MPEMLVSIPVAGGKIFLLDITTTETLMKTLSRPIKTQDNKESHELAKLALEIHKL